MNVRPDVSIVIPCYRAAGLARSAVAPLRSALEEAGLRWEIVVVDDGGGDFEDDAFRGEQQVTLIRFPENRGKGAAVRTGMLRARGRARIFTDVDIPFGTAPVVEIAQRLLAGGARIVIGDRTLPGSTYRLQLGWARRIASLAFTAIVGTIVTSGLYDTQCGLKGMTSEVADALFPLLRIDRFAFDVELIQVARHHSLAIDRVPVRLERNETSSVRLPRDAAEGARDLFRIRSHQRRGDYESPALRALAMSRNGPSA